MPRCFEIRPTASLVFYEYRPAGASTTALHAHDPVSGTSRLIFDPQALSREGETRKLDVWVPSPDGRHIACGISANGSENCVIHIVETASGKPLEERLKMSANWGYSWLPDSTGFFYNRKPSHVKPEDSDYQLNSSNWLHLLNTDQSRDILALGPGQYAAIPSAPEEFPMISVQPDGLHVLGFFEGGVRPESVYHLCTLSDLLAGRPQWQKLSDLEDEIRFAGIYCNGIYYLTSKQADNGKILRADLKNPSVSQARPVVPESGTVIEEVLIARDGLYLSGQIGGYSTLSHLDGTGRLTPIDLPFAGNIHIKGTASQLPGLWLSAESWLVPPTVFHLGSADQPLQARPLGAQARLDLSAFKVVRTAAVARDGTPIPLSIICRRDVTLDGRNPTLVETYGAYQMSSSPSFFNGRSIAFLELGGVFVTAHVRGGGEFGKRWWQAGFRSSKPNTWRDLIDCCRELVKRGWTSPKHLAITGTSAGGIAVGRALTEEPELFAAVISHVGVSNALRSEFTPNGPANIDEMGSVKDRDGFLALRAMDAYNAVRDGLPYPAVLLTAGIEDSRVAVSQPAKLAARLQAATRSGNPVLLSVNFEAGHGPSTRLQADLQQADTYGFALWRSGDPRFQPRSAPAA
ncbi:MAG: prolyl oligopeptidase family serine peptidase [Cyanobium sp.]